MGWIVILGIAFLMAVGGLAWAFVNTAFMIGHALNIPDPIIALAFLVLVVTILAGVTAFITRRPVTHT